MAKLGKVTKQPREIKPYTINFTQALPPGDNLQDLAGNITFEVSPAGPTPVQVDRYYLASGARLRFWVSGGQDQKDYTITALVITADGQKLENEIVVKVREVV